MKVLLWPTHYFPSIGGLETFTRALAVQLADWGHAVQVIANSEEFADSTLDQIPIRGFPFAKSLQPGDLKTIKEILLQIEQLIKAFAPDVIHIHGWVECFCFYQVRALQRLNIPICLTIHGLIEQNYDRATHCIKLWHMSSAVNAVSHNLRESVLAKTGLSHPRLQTIYNGLKDSPLPPLPLSSDPPKLLMVGRLSPEKCYPVAFHALALLLPKWPHLKLTLVGGGDLFAPLSLLKNHLKLNKAVEMANFVPPSQITPYYDAHTIVLVPSSYESFGLVAVEAALRERPVIASDVLGLKEVIDAPRTGLLVPPQNPQKLAEAIDLLLQNPLLMKQMGRSARQRALELFAIETSAAHYLNMYREVLNDKATC